MNDIHQIKNTDPFEHTRFIGYVSQVSPLFTKVHFPSSILLNKFRHAGEELQAGLVGNYVAIEGEDYGFLGKIIEIALPEKERLELSEKAFQSSDFHPTGRIEILISFDYIHRKIRKGLDQFPAVGSKVFICSTELLKEFFSEFGVKEEEKLNPILFNLGTLTQDENTNINISPQALFGRHCAIVGTTGGGKSFTTSKLIEEVIKNKGKAILIDPTGEYEKYDNTNTETVSFNNDANNSTFLHFSNLKISDFYMLLRPSEQVQLPKLQEAIKSLKLVKLLKEKDVISLDEKEKEVKGYINKNDYLEKKFHPRNSFTKVINKNPEIENLDGDFDFTKLPYQIYNECIWSTDIRSEKDGGNSENFGGPSERDQGNCQSLMTRAFFIIKNKYFESILGFTQKRDNENEFANVLKKFLSKENKNNLLRIALDKVPFENNLRELLVNAIGRYLLDKARNKEFISEPLIIFIDEAHQFLNKRILGEFSFDVELNSFDQIAKECRKYGLYLVISTQMPRDIPTGTLSQVGTFIAHRLINPYDKDAIENACSEANKYALSFLPILGAGEALLMGVDFPMPVILKINRPEIEPKYQTPILFKKEKSEEKNNENGISNS